MSEITILHLSDIHFKKNKEDHYKTFPPELQLKLLKDVDAHSEEHGAPDFVAVTGDIAFSGKRSEYIDAIKFVHSLKFIFPVETEFLVVPGNHDVDREQVDPFFSIYENIIKGERIDQFLQNKKH